MGAPALQVFSDLLSQPALLTLLVVVFIAGIVRGFAGFGTGLIVGPVAAALFSPAAAVVTIFVMDLGPANMLVLQAWRKANWREIIPVSIGYALLLPAGLTFLKFGDPLTLRWAICLVVLMALFALWSGYRYRGPRTVPISIGVGGTAGFLNGFAALPGPPVVIYWMAARSDHGVIRANLIMLFAIGEVLSGIGLWVAGIFSWEFIAMGILACLPYLGGLLIGMALFGKASETTYRRIAFSLVLVAAIASAPVLDNILR